MATGTDEAPDDASPLGGGVEGEIRELLGLFDVPAFARRGADLEYALNRLHLKLRRERASYLEMVHLRLRQWAALATGPDDWRDTFQRPLDELRAAAGGEALSWSSQPGTRRRRRTASADLVASVERFNRRWAEFFGRLNLAGLNEQVDRYNRYYLLEKECVLGSARLAQRHFVPRPRVCPEELLADYPPLPVPHAV